MGEQENRLQNGIASDYVASVRMDGAACESLRATEAELAALADEMEAVVFVSRFEDGRIAHLNRAGREYRRALQEAGGQVDYCYQLLWGRDRPCERCHLPLLQADRFTSYEYDSGPDGVPFVLRAKRVWWQGGAAQLGVVLSALSSGIVNRGKSLKLKMEQTIVASVRALSAGKTIQSAIEAVLAEIGDFYKADRAYVFEMDETGKWASNTYEWCGPGVPPEMALYQNVNFHENTPRWLATMAAGRAVVVSSHDDWRQQFPREGRLLVRPGADQLIMVPFRMGDHLGGFLGVDNPRFSQNDAALLQSLAHFVATEIEKRSLAAELHRLSFVDALTGLYNRNRYIRDIGAFRPQEHSSFAVVFVDINGLKDVNDNQGHQAGDALIAGVAHDLQAACGSCVAYRIGGDEFVVLCSGLSGGELKRMIMEFRTATRMHGRSVSIGAAYADRDIDIGRMTRQADERMYQSKAEYYRHNRDRRR